MTIEIAPSDTVIHVNRGKVDGNRKRGTHEPVLKLQKGKSGRGQYARHKIAILDQDGRVAGYVVYDPAGILACGAKAVIIAPHGARVED